MTAGKVSVANLIVNENHTNSILKQQLVREITCLERQLERLRLREKLVDEATVQTYEEMIESRRKMLHNLPWDE